MSDWKDKRDAQEIFQELVGGETFAEEVIQGLIDKKFSTNDFSDDIVGGYDFEWVITHFEYQDFRYVLYGEALPGGTVSMMNGRTLNLDEACNLEDFGWEIQNEVNDVVKDCMEELIVPKTGAHIEVPLIIVPEE